MTRGREINGSTPIGVLEIAKSLELELDIKHRYLELLKTSGNGSFVA